MEWVTLGSRLGLHIALGYLFSLLVLGPAPVGRFFYKLTGDGMAEQVDADIVATVGLWVGIGSGVEVGDRVIVRGAERLMPGQPIEVAADQARAD